MTKLGVRILMLLTVAIAYTGCATVVLGPKQLVGRKVLNTRVEVVKDWTTNGEVQRQGETVRIYSVKECKLHNQSVNSVEQTYQQDRMYEGLDRRIIYALAAAAAFGVGAWFFADAESLAADSQREAEKKGEKDYTNANEFRATGGVFVGLGLLAAIPVIVDTIRVSGHHTSIETVEEHGLLSDPVDYCGDRAFAGALVTAIQESGAIKIGATDEAGVLELPLRVLQTAPGGAITPIAVDGVEVGHWPSR